MLDSLIAPQLMVVVDTEEEFNWEAFPDRDETQVDAMEHVSLTQEICNEYGIKPCYVIDYPVASKPQGYNLLKQYYQAGQCEIGAHLHPWVNPPFDEELSFSNMYPGNLEAQLEYAKLKALSEQIKEVFGFSPSIYKAGRYGFGANTLDILNRLGFKVDVSFCPPIDHSADGGPDYSDCKVTPFWLNDDVLEIPLTGAFTGISGDYAKSLFNFGKKLESIKLPGIFSRLNLVDRLILSPEGYTAAEHRKVTDFLLAQGERIFTWSFHSPTVVPGNTVYVKNEREKQQYLDSFRRYFDYFFNDLGGQATTPTGIYNMLEKNT